MTERPETPLRRTLNAGSSPADVSHSRTPSRGSRLGGSELRTKALTPHGRAALREVEARRAGLTPGKDRRRSGRQQRETPRDILRLLNDENDDDDNEDDESLLLPSLAALEDENLTTRSIELPRRAVNEKPTRLFSRNSFGSTRGSYSFGNLNEAELGRDAMESSFLGGNDYENDDFPEMANSPFFGSDRAVVQGDSETRLHRRSLLPGRSSDIRPYNSPFEERDATFVFTVPQPEMPMQPEPSPSLETTQIGGFVMDEPSSPAYNTKGDDFTMDDEAMNGEHDSRRLSIETFENYRLSLDETSKAAPVEEATLETWHRSFQKKKKISKHGLKYSSLPLGVVKKNAISLGRNGGGKGDKLSRDALDAIMQATEWFFEQISDDLSTYSEHAGRKTIDESDVLMLMKRYLSEYN
ncbi:hypothetical protein SS1G_13178 [Sclerotinia sclerotiorum 1980 UF-70]|uniref:CENP-T/Histone H4 histone fold domain-containing protein n=1 Tax=Sclerotinia sclerotiorum (strain ATCC 18683 / 1980 / Ss-1) TaxID=665079 RepID=A7F6E9_SCLS1|nr:hypothetical protein SS1G_13178 [Sclerotinia sclerotiorum 1980 UF-70]EDN98320.1 hypothetical protein SS1G_13178 [Sclerotinia sclerotiorum 1980 UF-70]